MSISYKYLDPGIHNPHKINNPHTYIRTNGALCFPSVYWMCTPKKLSFINIAYNYKMKLNFGLRMRKSLEFMFGKV